MRLITGPVSLYGVKVVAAARVKQLSVDIEFVPFNIRGPDFYSPKHPDVERLNPKGQVPILIDGNIVVIDSTQILEYFEDVRPTPNLWPKDLKRRALARRLELEIDEVLIPHILRLRDNLRPETDITRTQREKVNQFYSNLETGLNDEYLVGELSFADIALYTTQVFSSTMQCPIPAQLTKLTRWKARVGSISGVAETEADIWEFLSDAGIDVSRYKG